MRRLLLTVVSALVLVPAAAAEPAKVGYPNSMASTGDSITRAFNTCFFPFFDCPSNSWSTGTSGSVNSHYRRILSANPLISGRNHNNAVTGAEMAELNGQLSAAVSQRVEYVTILMGANDVCAGSEAGMTSVDAFRSQFDDALRTVTTGLPDARIYVVSIPDVYRLWLLYKDSSSARNTWSFFGICQSMLANPGSTAPADEARRQRVRQRNIDLNGQLAQGCAAYLHCRFDNNATFNTQFVRSDVSTRDYFHPSVAGLAKLSSITWTAGYDFTDRTAPVSSASSTGGVISMAATDNAGVAGIEYRLASGWTRYTAPFSVAPGTLVTYRAVDVNGNVEATKTVAG